MLSAEGLHDLEGDIDNLQVLYDAGVRMAGITHFFDNELAGSAHGIDKGGLTAMIKASRLAITVVGSAVRLDVGGNNVAGNFQRNLDRFYTRATGRASGAG